MNAWLFVFAAVLIVGALLWRWTRFPRDGQYLVAAFLMLGLAGYAWQGHPNTPGSPVSPYGKAIPDDGNVRRFMTARFGAAGETLGYSDAWLKAGRPDLAVRTINIGLQSNPNNADLWVGLGGALVAASDGVVTPAATFAFEKAARLAPAHPGPAFFEGLAAAQGGKIEDAARSWLALLDRTPKDALWRQDLEMRLSAIAQMVTNAPNSGNSVP
jgi:cytochrome c-type biogenesis protein CcmH